MNHLSPSLHLYIALMLLQLIRLYSKWKQDLRALCRGDQSDTTSETYLTTSDSELGHETRQALYPSSLCSSALSLGVSGDMSGDGADRLPGYEEAVLLLWSRCCTLAMVDRYPLPSPTPSSQGSSPPPYSPSTQPRNTEPAPSISTTDSEISFHRSDVGIAFAPVGELEMWRCEDVDCTCAFRPFPAA